jgi:polysaccharide export outer membrane protein
MKLMRRGMSPLIILTSSRRAIAARLCLCAILLIVGFSQLVTAQQPSANATTASSPQLSSTKAGTSNATAIATAPEEKAASSDKSKERYRIGPGDLLDIRVFNKPQFSRDAVRVDACGFVRMPFIETDIQAAGRTESELSKEITRLLKEYLTRPQVDVFIKEYQQQPVAVIGAVRTPSRFQLQRRVRLLDLLSYVNGPADNAGRSIQVVHTPAVSGCENDATDNQADISSVDYYKLSDTLRGDEKANPYINGGDIISIAEADQIYVVGNVVRPSALALKDPITISRAIAMVGGTLPDSKKDKVRIVRQAPGSTAKIEIFVDLKAIDKRQAEDVELIANDIVEVQTNSGKRLLKSFIGAIVPSVAQLPVRVVP